MATLRNQFAPLWRSRVFFAPLLLPHPRNASIRWLVAKSGRTFVWRVVNRSLMLLRGDYAKSVRASLASAALLRPLFPPPSPRCGDLHHTARKAGFNDSARAARSVLLFGYPNSLGAMSNFAITRLDANKKPRSVVYAASLACWAHAAFVLLSYVNTI